MNSRGGPSLFRGGPPLNSNNFSESYIIFSRNTWNTVYAAGGWRLIQCNWAMLNLHSRAERETRKFYQDHYFLTDPDKFIFEFFPINSEWQLMERPITIQEFEDLPLLRSTFFHFGLGLEGNNAASIIDTNEAGEVFLFGIPFSQLYILLFQKVKNKTHSFTILGQSGAFKSTCDRLSL